MRIVKPSFIIMDMPDGRDLLKKIEQAGRTCYKSEGRITPDSAYSFAELVLKLGHLSVIEHVGATVRIVCDRGITHEIVRHRLASYSQESTRYANYSHEKFGSEITVIAPCFWEEDSVEYELWRNAMLEAEKTYMQLVETGASAQQARSVLPNSLKTEIVVTCNLREWRHIFSLRCDTAAHPQMREIMLPLLSEFKSRIPVIFDDLHEKFAQDIKALVQ